jgi:hypothetical protein
MFLELVGDIWVAFAKVPEVGHTKGNSCHHWEISELSKLNIYINWYGAGAEPRNKLKRCLGRFLPVPPPRFFVSCLCSLFFCCLLHVLALSDFEFDRIRQKALVDEQGRCN